MTPLRQTTASMLRSARSAEERPIKRYLPRGLTLEVTQMKTGDLVLVLERRDQMPSSQEWKTVLSHWPEPVPAGVIPTSRTEGRFHRLIGRWPRPAMLLPGA